MRAWSLTRPTGSDYVLVAQLVAARHNLFDGWLELPDVSSSGTAGLPSGGTVEGAWFEECYPPRVLETFDDLYFRTMTTTAKLVAPANTPDCSPFRSLLPQMPDEVIARQYERLAIKPDQVRVAGQAPVPVDDENDDADSDLDLLDETFSIIDEAEVERHTSTAGAPPRLRSLRHMRERGSTASLYTPPAAGGLAVARVVLAEPSAETFAAYRWYIEPWQLARRLLEQTNQESAATAASRPAADGGAALLRPGRLAGSPRSGGRLASTAPVDVLDSAGVAVATAPALASAAAAALHMDLDAEGGSSGVRVESGRVRSSSLRIESNQGSRDANAVSGAHFTGASSDVLQASTGPGGGELPMLSPILSVGSFASEDGDGPSSPQLAAPSPFAPLPLDRGYAGDGWPEVRQAGAHAGARLLRTHAQLRAPSPWDTPPALSMAVYQHTAALASTQQPQVAVSDEVLRTYLARASGRLASAPQFVNAAVGLPVRPLA